MTRWASHYVNQVFTCLITLALAVLNNEKRTAHKLWINIHVDVSNRSSHLYCSATKSILNRNTRYLRDSPHWIAMSVVTALRPEAGWKLNKEEGEGEEEEEGNLGWFNNSESLRDRLQLFQFPGKLCVKGLLRSLEWALVVGVLSCLGRVNKLLNCMRIYVLHCWECPSPWFHPLKHIYSRLLKSLQVILKWFHWCCSSMCNVHHVNAVISLHICLLFNSTNQKSWSKCMKITSKLLFNQASK